MRGAPNTTMNIAQQIIEQYIQETTIFDISSRLTDKFYSNVLTQIKSQLQREFDIDKEEINRARLFVRMNDKKSNEEYSIIVEGKQDKYNTIKFNILASKQRGKVYKSDIIINQEGIIDSKPNDIKQLSNEIMKTVIKSRR